MPLANIGSLEGDEKVRIFGGEGDGGVKGVKGIRLTFVWQASTTRLPMLHNEREQIHSECIDHATRCPLVRSSEHDETMRYCRF